MTLYQTGYTRRRTAGEEKRSLVLLSRSFHKAGYLECLDFPFGRLNSFGGDLVAHSYLSFVLLYSASDDK